LTPYVASGIEVTDGIVRDSGEMNDGIEALEVMRANIPDVSGSLFIAFGLHAEVTSVVPTVHWCGHSAVRGFPGE
jgi:hypothetical protein